jgi:hypothetical protein
VEAGSAHALALRERMMMRAVLDTSALVPAQQRHQRCFVHDAQQAHRHIVHVPTEQVEGEVIDV